MQLDRLRNNLHRGYTMPHVEYMDEKGLKQENLTEHHRAMIRIFEQQYDRSLNNDGYLDEKEETSLMAESSKIKQAIQNWYENSNQEINKTKVAAGVTFSLLGFALLLLGINQTRD